MSIAAAEYLIIAKLEWAQSGDPDRHFRDVVESIEAQGPDLRISIDASLFGVGVFVFMRKGVMDCKLENWRFSERQT